MSNKQILKRLLNEIQNYSDSRINRSEFSLYFFDTIESLEGVPFSVIDEAREWQYKLETQGDTLHTTNRLSKALIAWVNKLLVQYAK